MTIKNQSELAKMLDQTVTELQEKIASSPTIITESIRDNQEYFKPYHKGCMLLALIGINDPTALELDKATNVLSRFHNIHFSTTLNIAI